MINFLKFFLIAFFIGVVFDFAIEMSKTLTKHQKNEATLCVTSFFGDPYGFIGTPRVGPIVHWTIGFSSFSIPEVHIKKIEATLCVTSFFW